MKIFLIGYMGSGKSKAGESLAKLLNLPFIETDKVVETREGKSISAIFETSGQEYFREVEKAVLHETVSVKDAVVSTGGGLPCYSDNMQWMNDNGITVYLDANPGLLFHRLSVSKVGRPLIEKLNDVDLMEQITGHLAIRLPYYRQAKVVVPAASLNVKALAEKLAQD
jgi:shikimate kinase